MKETRKLPVKLTEAEIEEVVRKHSDACSTLTDIESRKRDALADFRHERKPFVEERDRLQDLKATGVEVREVECEHRDSLVTGQTEVVRLDTGEVIETYVPGASVDDDEPDQKQPALPFAAPPAPVLRCTGIDRDGMLHAITAEQADMIEMGRAAGETFVPVKMSETLTAYIIEVRRGKACEFCGVVPDALGQGHRPECDDLKSLMELGSCESCSRRLHDEGDFNSDDEGVMFCTECWGARLADPNDTAAVAARIDAMTPVNDAPLVPAGDASKPLVKLPKRKKSAAAQEGAE